MLASGSFKEIRLWDLTLGQISRVTVLRDIGIWLPHSILTRQQDACECELLRHNFVMGCRNISLRHSISAHVDSIQALAFSPDSQTLASGGYWNSDAERTIRVWHIHTGQLMTTFENHTAPVLP